MPRVPPPSWSSLPAVLGSPARLSSPGGPFADRTRAPVHWFVPGGVCRDPQAPSHPSLPCPPSGNASRSVAPNEAFCGLYGAPGEGNPCHPLEILVTKSVPKSGRRNEGGAFKSCSRVLKGFGAVHAWGSGSARSLEPHQSAPESFSRSRLLDSSSHILQPEHNQ